MKMIINKHILFLLLSFFIFYSCSNKNADKDEVLSPSAVLEEVSNVIAIGKVNAESGAAIIASNTSGIINKLTVKEGDTVKKGDILILLNNEPQQVEVDLAKTRLKENQEKNNITNIDIEREKITLNYLRDKYSISKSLYEKQAETKDVVSADENNYRKQQQVVDALLRQVKVNQSLVQEQKLILDKSQLTVAEFNVTAPQSGVITTFNAKLGQNVSPSEILGEIINLSHIIIDAEVDELFADRIAKGQQVTFVNINTKQNLGEGIIVYTSPTLMNKSILFESANEADDRRVRRIKIKPTSNQNLLTNSKIECQIKLN